MKSVFRTSLFWIVIIIGFSFYMKRFNQNLAEKACNFLYAQETQTEEQAQERIEEKIENIEDLLEQIESNMQESQLTIENEAEIEQESEVTIPTQEELNQRRILELEAELDSLQNNE